MLKHTVAYSLIGLLLASCASLPMHNAVPEPAAATANVEGYPSSIRSWEDSPNKGLAKTIEKRVDSYMALHNDYYRKNRSYPAMNYLALSGGSNNGAFAAGLLCGWTQAGTRPQFTVVTGVSTGALIAPFAFLGPKYDGVLKEQYTTTKSENIFLADIWTVLNGLTGGLGLVDTSPLKQRLDDMITPELLAEIAAEHRKGRLLLIGTTNLEAQRAVIWNIGVIANSGQPDALELFKKILLASASVPGIFDPVFIDVVAGGEKYQEIHVDGGVAAQVFLFPTKSSRMDRIAFANHGIKRNLYIIRNGKIAPEYKAMKPGFYSISERSIDTLIKYQGISDLFELYALSQRDGMNYNLTYIPSDFTSESKELFDPAYMENLFNMAQEMGKRGDHWLKQPPGFQYID